MGTQAFAILEVHSCSGNISSAFWQQWELNQDYLYRCCLRWMGGNHTDAEDVLSRAMLKAWEKVRECTGVITNFRAWLTRLTHNLCIDIHRERNRGAKKVESLEAMTVGENFSPVSMFETPDAGLMRKELRAFICRAIDDLQPRLREPFVLHFVQNKSYQDIAQHLRLSLNNVYKRIQQARDILQKHLRRYLSGLDDSLLDSSKPSGKREKPVVERCLFYQTMISDSQIVKTMESISERINYEITATCLKTLSHTWYHSPSPLVWS